MIFWQLFITFFQIGLFTIGGGYAMIPMITQQVTQNGWMTIEQLTDFIGISESTPGPFAVNIATFVGSTTAGAGGALLATFGVVLPSFLIILFIARYFNNFRNNFYVSNTMAVVRPVTVGLIAAAVFDIAITNFAAVDIQPVPINVKSLILLGILIPLKLIWKKLHPIAFIGLSAAAGVGVYALLP